MFDVLDTVVINCAGIGKRVRLDYPKTLIKIRGKPIIIRYLELLRNYQDVRIVVGFQADKIIKTVRAFRRNVLFIHNPDYKITDALASLYLGSRSAHDYIIALVGDLVFDPKDFANFVKYDGESIGYSDANSEHAVFTKINQSNGIDYVTKISLQKTPYEWIGLVKIRKDKIFNQQGHIYQLISKYLPMRGKYIKCREIDTPEDLKIAVKWANKLKL